MKKDRALTTAAAVLALTGCMTTPPPASSSVTPPESTTSAVTPAAGATSTQAAKETLASALVDREGDSVETAVTVPVDAPDEGVEFENQWIYHRVGRFRRKSQGTGALNNRRYNVIEVETPSGEVQKFYFDITDVWNRWEAPKSP